MSKKNPIVKSLSIEILELSHTHSSHDIHAALQTVVLATISQEVGDQEQFVAKVDAMANNLRKAARAFQGCLFSQVPPRKDLLN